MSEPVLTVDDLRVSFASDDGATVAVDGIDLRCERGETLALVGESGCGKSAAMLAILGLLPRSGRVCGGAARLAGHRLIGARARDLCDLRGDRVAMVFQDPMTSLNPFLKVGKQVAEPLVRHRGASWRAARQRTVELLDAVGIGGPAVAVRRYPHEFSGGQRQRIMIAMALACDPDLLIADEPTTALDVTTQAQILALLREQQTQRDMGMILITHDLGVVATTCDRVAVMYAGRIVETAPVKRLFTAPRHPYTRGLLGAIPDLEGPVDRDLATIPGLPPRLRESWAGCAFAPRCPWCEPACRDQPALLREQHSGHRHRCRRDIAGTGFPSGGGDGA
ncbi:MAG: ABC transporter ATP-binding protein [Planctomycetota bacterium]